MKVPLPDAYDIDRVFKLAGFPYGRPTAERPEGYMETGSNTWDTLVALFSDEHIDYLIDALVINSIEIPTEAGNYPVFDHLLAAELVNSINEVGLTQLGRHLDTTSVNYGDVSENFAEGETVRAWQVRLATTLRAKAYYLKKKTD